MKNKIYNKMQKAVIILALTVSVAIVLSAGLTGSLAYRTGDDVIVMVSEQKFIELTLASFCSQSGDMLPGAVISVEHTSGWNDTVQLETGTAPVLIPERNTGTYTIRDVKAPGGYKAANPNIKLIVDESGISAQETVAIYYDPLGTGEYKDDTRHDETDKKDETGYTDEEDEQDSGDGSESSKGKRKRPEPPPGSIDPRPDPETDGYIEFGYAGVPVGRWDWDEDNWEWIYTSYHDDAGVPRTGGSREGTGLRFLTVILSGVVLSQLILLEVIKSRE